MIQDIIRALIQRIFRDKILMGLVVIGVIAVFMTGMDSGHEPPLEGDRAQAQEEAEQPPPPGAPEAAAKPPEAQKQAVEPTVACDFVKWWLGGAMDYHAGTANKNHDEAFKWMSPDAAETFKSSFWNEGIAQGIAQGTLVAAFQPVTVEAEAINPDGTVVITVKGTLVMQYAGQPSTQPLQTDFLVRKEPEGLRIAGVFNRAISQAPAAQSHYSY